MPFEDEAWLPAAQIPHPRRLVRRADPTPAPSCPPRRSHTRAVLSSDAVTTWVPSALNDHGARGAR
jgi:hypothetical protein